MGYLIEIDHGNCINCGICMDVCPVEALDMSRPQAPGLEASARRRADSVADGASDPGRRVRRLLDLRQRMSGGRHHADDHGRSYAARAATGPRSPDRRLTAGQPGSRCRPSPARRSSRPRSRRSTAVAAWRSGHHRAGARRSVSPRPMARSDAPCQAACPAGTDAGRYVGLVAAGRIRRCLCRRGRGESVPVRVRLDLHRAVRSGLPPGRARRADRDPRPQAVRGRARHPAADRQADVQAATERVAIVGGGPGRHVGGLLPGPPRLRRHRPRGDACAGRHDGDRHPGLPPAAGDAAGRDRRGSSTSGSSSGSTRSWAVTSPWPTSSADYQAVFLATGAPKSRPLGRPRRPTPRRHPGDPSS